MNDTSYRKWGARTITAIAGLLIMWASTGSWDTEETIGLITLVSGAVVSLLVPAEDAVKSERAARRNRP